MEEKPSIVFSQSGHVILKHNVRKGCLCVYGSKNGRCWLVARRTSAIVVGSWLSGRLASLLSFHAHIDPPLHLPVPSHLALWFQRCVPGNVGGAKIPQHFPGLCGVGGYLGPVPQSQELRAKTGTGLNVS